MHVTRSEPEVDSRPRGHSDSRDNVCEKGILISPLVDWEYPLGGAGGRRADLGARGYPPRNRAQD